MKTTTADRIKSQLNVVLAISDAIKELKQVPSGHLYARLMSVLSLEQYNQVIEFLKAEGFVTETNHLLEWNDQKYYGQTVIQ